MRLRLILLVLSLLAFLSAWTGGYLYYSALKDAAFTDAQRRAVTRMELIKRNLGSFLSENIRPVKTLAGMPEIGRLLAPHGQSLADEANQLLDHFNRSLAADVCYVMDRSGTTIASSNRLAADSFVGKNFGFRPYFQQAIYGYPATYLALGTTSHKRGAYHSHPIYHPTTSKPVGVAVIKASIELIEKQLITAGDETVMVVDPLGIVFISNRADWLYRTIWELAPDQEEQLTRSLQFGHGPWPWIGLEINGNRASDQVGQNYFIHQAELTKQPGWQVIYLQNLRAISRSVADPLFRITGPTIVMLCFMIGLAVFLLYRKASRDLLQRRLAERALRLSEERYRSIYHNAPAMLHSINAKGELISVSEHWLAALGYSREEVIGRRLSRFLTKTSGHILEKEVLPVFLKSGFVKDIPYIFVKKNGETIDSLVSAIAERDESGRIVRSLAVSIDVTERKKAEEALQVAKEKLSRYSKDLERQVSIRTREISNMVKYTPALVHIKDAKGRYRLVNSRYEDLFGVKDEDIRGKTDYDIFPKAIADRLRETDLLVLNEKSVFQVEEKFPQKEGDHTYLVVKFPVYDDQGQASGVCGIAMDITAVKKAQDQSKRLSARIMESQEMERGAIARELHDELGQLLTALRIELVWMRKRLQERDPEAAARALTMCDLVDKTIEDVRHMAIRLRPGVLDTLGLVDALEWYTADFEKRTGVACIFEADGVKCVPNNLATAAYRIGQEALTNVTRHAEASQVRVSLLTENRRLTLAVGDNGRGFDTAILADTEALGVAGMEERAGLVGGDLTVHSRPGEGTRVAFKVPMQKVPTQQAPTQKPAFT